MSGNEGGWNKPSYAHVENQGRVGAVNLVGRMDGFRGY